MILNWACTHTPSWIGPTCTNVMHTKLEERTQHDKLWISIKSEQKSFFNPGESVLTSDLEQEDV